MGNYKEQESYEGKLLKESHRKGNDAEKKVEVRGDSQSGGEVEVMGDSQSGAKVEVRGDSQSGAEVETSIGLSQYLRLNLSLC